MEEQKIILPKIVDPKEFKNSWFKMSEETYRADLDATNFSTLKYFLESPAAYLYNLKKPKEPTKQMRYGTIAHMALLESEKFKANYIVEPIFEGLTAKGEKTTSKNSLDVKRQYEEWRNGLSKDAVILTEDQLESLTGIINSMLESQELLSLIEHGEPELVGKWVDPETGILCKAKLDLPVRSCGWLMDVKTTSKSANWEEFMWSVENLDYDFQIAMYHEAYKQIEGKPPVMCGWIVPETFGPWDFDIHLVHDLFIEKGMEKYRKCMNKLKECLDTGVFPKKHQMSKIEMRLPREHYITGEL